MLETPLTAVSSTPQPGSVAIEKQRAITKNNLVFIWNLGRAFASYYIPACRAESFPVGRVFPLREVSLTDHGRYRRDRLPRARMSIRSSPSRLRTCPRLGPG